MNIIKSFTKGAGTYLSCAAILSALMVFHCAIILFLGMNDEGAPMKTIGDAINIFVFRFFYDGTLIGGIAWKWHSVIATFWGIGHSINEAQ